MSATLTMPIVEAREKLTQLSDQLEREPEIGAVEVTRHGKPVLAVLSWDFYETLIETMEILADAKLVVALRQSLKELEQGKRVSWEGIKEELNLDVSNRLHAAGPKHAARRNGPARVRKDSRGRRRTKV